MEKLTSQEIAALQLQIKQLDYVQYNQYATQIFLQELLINLTVNPNTILGKGVVKHLKDIEQSISYCKTHLETLQTLLNEQ
jgi:hypothetical protein